MPDGETVQRTTAHRRRLAEAHRDRVIIRLHCADSGITVREISARLKDLAASGDMALVGTSPAAVQRVIDKWSERWQTENASDIAGIKQRRIARLENDLATLRYELATVLDEKVPGRALGVAQRGNRLANVNALVSSIIKYEAELSKMLGHYAASEIDITATVRAWAVANGLDPDRVEEIADEITTAGKVLPFPGRATG